VFDPLTSRDVDASQLGQSLTLVWSHLHGFWWRRGPLDRRGSLNDNDFGRWRRFFNYDDLGWRSDDSYWGLRRRIGRTSAEDKRDPDRKRTSEMHGPTPQVRMPTNGVKRNCAPSIGKAASS